MNGDSQLLPTDANWSEDKVLFADLTQLNAAIARYVLRQLDVDAQQAEPIPPDEEEALGRRLVAIGERVQGRASRHVPYGNQPGRVVEVAARSHGRLNRDQCQEIVARHRM